MNDLIGIDREGIPDIQERLTEYREGIDEPLNALSAKLEYADAFRGSTIAETMKEFVQAVIDEIKKMTIVIDDFNNSLNIVSMNYQMEADRISGQVGIDSSNVEGLEVKTGHGVKDFSGSSSDGGGGTPITDNPGPRTPTPKEVTLDDGGGNKPTPPDGNPTGTDTNPSNLPEGFEDNGNGIDNSRIAGTEQDAVNGNFIPEDQIYTDSFESDNVTVTEGENGGYKVSNDGTDIGWTDAYNN